MHDLSLILTLTGGLGGALIGGYVTQRLRFSPIVGYLIAGILVGPHTPGFVADRAIAEQLAELGVILLMFGVGLQFHIEDLLRVRRVAVPGAIAQSLVATALGAAAASYAGWGPGAGVVFGIALSVASTVVLVRVLSDNRQLHTPAGHIAVGWLVVEDLFTVLVLVLMPVFFGSGTGVSPVLAVGFAAIKVVALTVFTILFGGRAIPWMLTEVARTQSRELFTLAVLATALGIAVASTAIFGVSMALGAFLAGLVVGRSDFSVRAAADALPMRDAFAVLFFVSVGMLLDPGVLVSSPGFIAATLAVILLGKPLAALAIVLLCRYPLKTALVVAAALAQIGEFSFIVATVANELGVLTPEATNVLIAAAIISITINPLLFRAIGRVRDNSAQPASSTHRHRAVVVGYGPIGRTVTRLLRENDITPTVIELNADTVQALSTDGMRVVHGDAMQPETLWAAGITESDNLVVTIAGGSGSANAFRAARAQNPNLLILARATHLREVPALRAAGADVVASGEGEVALAFTAAILERLGATAEQIDRERVRVRAELYA
jgi:CPA2 family monovalent cation:H+ antiporter-2